LLLGSAAGLRAELGIPADALIGIVAGSLIRRKGHDILFQAMRTGAAGPFHLLVVGDGPERESYQKQSCGLPVHFLGHRDDVGPIMRDAADFLVAPSRQEAFGRVIIEAALAGIPAIGTRVDGIPEAILEDQTGLLVPPESPEALADAIARLSADGQLRRRLGATAAQRAHELFTIDRAARLMIEEYRSTISRYRSSTGSGLRRLKPYLGLMGAFPAPQESAA
jgi:glycosyltransferase involved in cell wall biosynthesis